MLVGGPDSVPSYAVNRKVWLFMLMCWFIKSAQVIVDDPTALNIQTSRGNKQAADTTQSSIRQGGRLSLPGVSLQYTDSYSAFCITARQNQLCQFQFPRLPISLSWWFYISSNVLVVKSNHSSQLIHMQSKAGWVMRLCRCYWYNLPTPSADRYSGFAAAVLYCEWWRQCQVFIRLHWRWEYIICRCLVLVSVMTINHGHGLTLARCLDAVQECLRGKRHYIRRIIWR